MLNTCLTIHNKQNHQDIIAYCFKKTQYFQPNNPYLHISFCRKNIRSDKGDTAYSERRPIG